MTQPSLREDIKQMIYENAYTGAMADEIEDGQLIGLKTGNGLELDKAVDAILHTLKERIEGMKKDTLNYEKTNDEWFGEEKAQGFNAALDAVKEMLTK